MEAKPFKHKSPVNKAQGMVEFAMVLPLLLLLIYGIIESGRLLFLYTSAMTSSREAARYGSAAGDVSGTMTYYADCTGMREAAKRIGRFAGVQDANISINYDHGPGSTSPFATCPLAATDEVVLGDRVIVQVNTLYQPILPMVRFVSFPVTSVTRRTIVKDVDIEGTPPSPVTPTLSFVLVDQSADEGVGQMVAQLQLSAPTSKAVSVDIAVSGTAIEGDDYNVSTTHVVLTPGETIYDMTIDVFDDVIDEDDETVILAMGTPTHAIKGTPDVHTATIIDNDDPPFVYFTSEAQSQTEDLDTVIGLELSAPSSREITVNYGVTGSALGAGVDYSITASPVVIPPGDTTAVLYVDLIDDTLDEDDEMVIVTLGAPINAIMGTPDVHTLTIVDNDDPPEIFFTWANQNCDETVGSVFAEVKLSQISSKEVTATFSVGGTASAGSDFTVDTAAYVIPAGELTATREIKIIADADDTETDETIELSLGTLTNALPGSPSTHVVTITNTPVVPEVYFAKSSATVNESDGSFELLVLLSAAASQDVSVPFNVAGTATSGEDFTLTTSPVVIPAGSSGTNITINLIDDAIDEVDETVEIAMGTPSFATLGSPSFFRLTIMDDDNEPSVYFATNAQRVYENAGIVQVTVQLSVISAKDVTVPFTVTGTATAGTGNDYTISTSPLVISAGSSSAVILVSVLDDTKFELEETVILTLGTPTNAILGSPAVFTLTILDNEPVCPTADSLPFFGTDGSKLAWNISSPNPLVPVKLVSVSIHWPEETKVNLNAITFGDPIYAGSAPPPYFSVNTPYPLWTGTFTTRQMIFAFDKDPRPVNGNFYQVIATFEGCAPISGTIPSN